MLDTFYGEDYNREMWSSGEDFSNDCSQCPICGIWECGNRDCDFIRMAQYGLEDRINAEAERQWNEIEIAKDDLFWRDVPDDDPWGDKAHGYRMKARFAQYWDTAPEDIPRSHYS